MQSKIISFVINLSIKPRPIYFARAGISINSDNQIMGGDSDLSQKGIKYSKNLNELF